MLGGAEALAELGCQLVDGKGFLEEAGQAFSGKALHGVLLIVTAGEEHRKLRTEFADLLEYFRAVETGHGEIEDDGDNVFDVIGKGLEALLAVFC